MRAPYVLAVLLVVVCAGCGGTSTVPRPSSETLNNETSTTQGPTVVTQPDLQPSVGEGRTTTSIVSEAPTSTTEPVDTQAEDSFEEGEESETNEEQIATTIPTAPATTYEILTEEPADIFSGGVETWEPDA